MNQSTKNQIPLNDHFPIFMSINKIRATKDAHAMNRINYNKLKTEAELINWSELSLINEPNLALNNLVSKIKICLSKAEYSKKDYKKDILYPRKNWITSAIIKSCVTKEKLYKLLKKDPNNTKKRDNSRKFNLILKKFINKAKESFDKEQIQTKMKNPKSLQNVINQKLGKNGKRNKSINYIIDNSVKITDSTNMAEHMKKFFAKQAKRKAIGQFRQEIRK